jgi:hypothetical protein
MRAFWRRRLLKAKYGSRSECRKPISWLLKWRWLIRLSGANLSEATDRQSRRFATGASPWALSGVQRIDDFFKATSDGRCRSALWTDDDTRHLGFDHRNALMRGPSGQPGGAGLDSVPQVARNPFHAFRDPVPGSATGAHIHIAAVTSTGPSDVMCSRLSENPAYSGIYHRPLV